MPRHICKATCLECVAGTWQPPVDCGEGCYLVDVRGAKDNSQLAKADRRADRTPRRLTGYGVAGVVVFCAGLLAWLWQGDWEWAVTGLLMMIGLAAAGSYAEGKK